jgi:hypothetical protein
MTQAEITPVIFRKFSDGDIIALFPAMVGDNSPRTCGSYMHIGQHGAADPGLVESTRLAKPDEYAALQSELESIGYRLKVYRRFQSRWHAERKAQIDHA